MTDLTEIRRAKFEHAVRRDWSEREAVLERLSDGYMHNPIDTAWWGFNAALDSVVVDLPKPYQNHLDGDVFDADDVIEAIQTAGIKTK